MFSFPEYRNGSFELFLNSGPIKISSEILISWRPVQDHGLCELIINNGVFAINSEKKDVIV